MKTQWRCNTKITCPFCGADYISEKEVRPLVECRYCGGKGVEAKRLERRIDKLVREGDKRKLKTILPRIASGYWRFRVRSRLEDISKEVHCDE